MKNTLKSAGILLAALCFSGVVSAQNQFANGSTRAPVGTGDAILINEFTISGSGTAKILVRGLGPSLTGIGISGALADPTLVLSDANGNVIGSNDNWRDTQETEIMATGIPPTENVESAILATLSPGTYVAVERGKNNTTGVGVNEVYDVSGSGGTATVVAYGTRGGDASATGIPVVGVILTTQEKVLVRSLGPSLGLSGQMADPTLTLYNQMGTVVATNNDWQSSQQTDIQNSGLAPGDPKDSALIATLPASSYVAIGTGNGGANGIAFTQLYILSASGIYPGPPLPPSPPTPTPGATPTPGPTATPGPTSTPTPAPTSAQLLNISTRLRVLNDPNELIGGFIITGTASKRVLIRGIGPSLAGSISGALANPTLELHQGDSLLAMNDDWKSDQRAEIEATTIPPSNDFESAIVRTLAPGFYTAILRGKDNGVGIGVVEAYDLDSAANSRLANISTRGFVDTGDNAMIGGFIVGGTGTARVMVRALGPSVPVAGALADPTLEIHDGNGTTIATNDNWKTRSDGSSQQAEIEATTIPPSNDLESATVQTLAPGGYTAVIRGSNNTTGVALVEAYDLQ